MFSNSKQRLKKLEEEIKVLCECGVNIGYGQLSVHRKTKKHIKLMKTLSSEKVEVVEVQEVVEVF